MLPYNLLRPEGPGSPTDPFGDVCLGRKAPEAGSLLILLEPQRGDRKDRTRGQTPGASVAPPGLVCEQSAHRGLTPPAILFSALRAGETAQPGRRWDSQIPARRDSSQPTLPTGKMPVGHTGETPVLQATTGSASRRKPPAVGTAGYLFARANMYRGFVKIGEK